MFHYLEWVVPDITDQYSSFKVDTPFLRLKVRGLHAFQMSLVKIALGAHQRPPHDVVDIGDSSGTHTQYLRQYCQDLSIRVPTCWSVNWDPEAVRKIRSKGLDARLQNIERPDTDEEDCLWADVAMCFETLEHLENPIAFLTALNVKTLIITVPYVHKSRVGLDSKTGLENTHVFELSPEDWTKIFLFTGWDLHNSRIYRQYPSWWPLIGRWWKRNDFEGFWGVVLIKEVK